jgi:hypothetical protein
MGHPHERRGEIGGTRRPSDDSSRLRHVLWRVDWVWRRVVPALCLGLALTVLIRLDDKVDRTQVQIEAQREGRRVARQILCGGLKGVQDAGRQILLGELPPPAPRLPRMSGDERRSRELFAQSYAQVISRGVLKQAGIEAAEVLRPDGTVDCAELERIATKETARAAATASGG